MDAARGGSMGAAMAPGQMCGVVGMVLRTRGSTGRVWVGRVDRRKMLRKYRAYHTMSCGLNSEWLSKVPRTRLRVDAWHPMQCTPHGC
eukprot:795814-Prorocentrum_lima.AAC.1